jgi:hypothetical protein
LSNFVYQIWFLFFWLLFLPPVFFFFLISFFNIWFVGN